MEDIIPFWLQKAGLVWFTFIRVCQSQVFIGEAGCHPAPRGTFQKAQLQQIGLIDIHDSIRFLADSSGYGVKPDGAAVELLYDGVQNFAVYLVETYGVHLEPA